jgi:hypothetical protein
MTAAIWLAVVVPPAIRRSPPWPPPLAAPVLTAWWLVGRGDVLLAVAAMCAC